MTAAQTSRIDEIVSQIRTTIDARSSAAAGTSVPNLDPLASFPQSRTEAPEYRRAVRQTGSELSRWDDAIAQAADKVGACPPAPATLRGRLGAFVIRVLSRAFWWLTLSMKECLHVIVSRNREQTMAFEKLHLMMSDTISDSLRIAMTFDRLQGDVIAHATELRGFASIQSSVQQLQQDLEALREQVSNSVQNELSSLKNSLSELGLASNSVQNELSSLKNSLSELGLATNRLRADVYMQQARLSHVVREIRAAVPPSGDAVPSDSALSDANIGLERLYVDFENVFRGPRSEIRERLRVYVPLLRHAEAGTPEGPVLDLGCGRGEWLELLREEGIESRGIDRNGAMLELCRDLGLNVTTADALDHLRSLAENSVGAITSFHMIEHMRFEQVIALLDEALRVLLPGGINVLETPNPGNLAVGASTFHLDPTHLRPIPHQLLLFFAEARGFCDVRIQFLNPYPDSVRLPEDTPFSRRFNECFYGPQDYALVAYSPQRSRPS